VEADAGQFVFDPRQAVFYPEKRPFFLDGIEQYSTPNQLIYTRRIVAPLGAAKLNGKVGRTTLALLSAVDDRATSADGQHHPVFNIARVQQDIGGQSRIGAVYTDKVDGRDSNRVLGFDAWLSFKTIYSLQLQSAFSRTQLAEATTTAPLWQAQFVRSGRTFSLRYLLNGIDDDFRASAGFISRAGITHGALEHRLTTYGPKGGWFESWNNSVILDGTWQYEDFAHGRGAQDRKLHLATALALRKGWRVRSTLMFESYGYDEQLYDDYRLGQQQEDLSWIYLPFVGTPRLPNIDVELTVNTPQFKTLSANAFVLFGNRPGRRRLAADGAGARQRRVPTAVLLPPHGRVAGGPAADPAAETRVPVDARDLPALHRRVRLELPGRSARRLAHGPADLLPGWRHLRSGPRIRAQSVSGRLAVFVPAGPGNRAVRGLREHPRGA
jgi:hypothetical protein